MNDIENSVEMSWLSNGVSVTSHEDDFIRYTRRFDRERLPVRLF